MATQTDLRNTALEKLGVLAAGEIASAEDAALVDERAGYIHEELIDNGLVAFALSDIPSAALLPMADVLAWECWEAFNGDDGAQQAMTRASAGRARLARQAQRTEETPTQAEYF